MIRAADEGFDVWCRIAGVLELIQEGERYVGDQQALLLASSRSSNPALLQLVRIRCRQFHVVGAPAASIVDLALENERSGVATDTKRHGRVVGVHAAGSQTLNRAGGNGSPVRRVRAVGNLAQLQLDHARPVRGAELPFAARIRARASIVKAAEQAERAEKD